MYPITVTNVVELPKSCWWQCKHRFSQGHENELQNQRWAHISDFSFLHKLNSKEDPLRLAGAVQVKAFFEPLYTSGRSETGGQISTSVAFTGTCWCGKLLHSESIRRANQSCSAKAIRVFESFRELHSSWPDVPLVFYIQGMKHLIQLFCSGVLLRGSWCSISGDTMWEGTSIFIFRVRGQIGCKINVRCFM